MRFFMLCLLLCGVFLNPSLEVFAQPSKFQKIYGNLPAVEQLRPVFGSPVFSDAVYSSRLDAYLYTVVLSNKRGQKLRLVYVTRTSVLFSKVKQNNQQPVVVFLNKCGNQTLFSPEDTQSLSYLQSGYRGEDTCQPAMSQPGWREDFWSIKTALDQGLSLVSLHESEIAPDHTAGFFRYREANIAASDFQPGVIAVWASGIRNVIRFLKHSPEFKGRRIGVMGHSRRGKAALLAAANTPQIDFVLAHQTGTLGVASVQDSPLESLDQITGMFPHWFTPKLRDFKDAPEKICCTQADLIKTIAPRPVLITDGYFDPWASYWLSLKTVQASQSAYREVYQQRQLTFNKTAQTYRVGRSKVLLKAPIAHAQAFLPHTMHSDYWRIMGLFLKYQF